MGEGKDIIGVSYQENKILGSGTVFREHGIVNLNGFHRIANDD